MEQLIAAEILMRRSGALTAPPTGRAAAAPGRFAALSLDIAGCCACPRLIHWCRAVAVEKKREFRNDTYWGRPVPSIGDPDARLLIVGLAPAAHGANRTGRMF